MREVITQYHGDMLELANSDSSLTVVNDPRYRSVEISMAYEADTNVTHETTVTFSHDAFAAFVDYLNDRYYHGYPWRGGNKEVIDPDAE